MDKKKSGLTTKEAQDLLAKYGPNLVKEKRKNNLVLFLQKFWSPISWMLEIAIILQFVLGKYDERIIITVLLIFNSILRFSQEEHSNRALETLKKNLVIQARVLRDSIWQLVSAKNLVQGDVVKLQMGDLAPADIRLFDGKILIKQSALTGESLPLEKQEGELIYAGSIINKGEATGQVVATGKQTYYGKTISLLQTSETKSHTKEIIFQIVKRIVAVDVFFVLIIFCYSLIINHPSLSLIPFVLILLVASIPIALPATFTLAATLGALYLTKRGVLVTRLSAIEEAATMDVLCVDKTGTITQKSLELAELKVFSPYTEEQLLEFAALVSHEATQDPIDMAILKAIRVRNIPPLNIKHRKFLPFDPSLERTEAVIETNEKQIHLLKGAPLIISKLLTKKSEFLKNVSLMEKKGCHVIAIAVEHETDKTIELAGLLAFYDPPRKGVKKIIKALKKLGIRLLMLTGDSVQTAKIFLRKWGLESEYVHLIFSIT